MSSPSRLCSGTSITLMITGSSHLCSHQQVDDHCKRKDHTTKHTIKQQKGKLEPKLVLSCNQIYFHNPIYIHHPSRLWPSNQYTKTRLDSSRYIWSGRIQRMLALVVDTSAHPRAAHPRAAHPRAMCYKCYNESIPHTQG